MLKDLIKKRIIPFVPAEETDDLVYRGADAPIVPQTGPNPFSTVQIQPGTPVDLPRILPEQPAPVVQPVQPAVQPVQGVFPVAPEPQPAPVQPAVYPVAPSASTQGEINAIRNKDYSKAVYDESGNLVKKAGENRDKKWSTLEKIGNAAMGFLVGVGKGGLGGGIVEGVRGATDRNYNEKLADKRALAELYPQLKQEQQQEDFQANQQYNRARTANVYADNIYQNERLAQQREETERKKEDRISRERTAKMNAVAGMFKNIPEFIPGDPRYADIEKALGDVDLPITPKDAKKKVDLKQDQRTGEWTVILTNPLDGTQEVRPVMKNGEVFKSTPTVVMQGEYGMLRQNDQQTFTAEQNQLNRDQQVRLKAIEQEQRIQLENLKNANDAIQKATDAATKAQAEEAKRQATQKYNDLRNERLTLQNQKLVGQ